MSPTVRERREDDLPALVEVLARQQPASGYPVRWPLPFPAEQFIRRAGELAAWVALDPDRPGAGPVGHVSVLEHTADDDAGRLWCAAHGCDSSQLGVVTALFVDPSVLGTGAGGGLLEHATAWIHARGRRACLDVLPGHARAERLYRHRGWEEVGTMRFDWLPEQEPPVLVMVLRS